jgi:alanine dehydrogenase
MPGAVPLTSSHALVNATLPYGLAIANEGLAALLKDPGLLAGLNVIDGRLTNQAVAESLSAEWIAPEQALAA